MWFFLILSHYNSVTSCCESCTLSSPATPSPLFSEQLSLCVTLVNAGDIICPCWKVRLESVPVIEEALRTSYIRRQCSNSRSTPSQGRPDFVFCPTSLRLRGQFQYSPGSGLILLCFRAHDNAEDRLISKIMNVPNLQCLANSLLSQSAQTCRENAVVNLIRSAKNLDIDVSNRTKTLPATWFIRNHDRHQYFP